MTLSGLVKGAASDAEIIHEFMQYEIIRSIFVRSTEREIALKGGFAMRALFGSERRTKDIDLQHDMRRATLRRTQTLIRSAIDASLAGGMLSDVRVTEPKQTDTVARWKINGRTARGSHVHLTIEVSRRPMPADDCLTRKEMRSPGPTDQPLVMVDTYSADAMAGAKTIALLSENRLAPRDIWDIGILISMRAEPPPHMIDHLRNQGARDRLFDKMEIMTWDLFQKEVMPSLPSNIAVSFSQGDFEGMKIRVALTVEKWLIDPSETAPLQPGADQPGPAP